MLCTEPRSASVLKLKWSFSAGLLAGLLSQAPGMGVVTGITIAQSRKARVVFSSGALALAMAGCLLAVSAAMRPLGLLFLTWAVLLGSTIVLCKVRQPPFISLSCLGAFWALATYLYWMSLDRERFSPVWLMISASPETVHAAQWMILWGSFFFTAGVLAASTIGKPIRTLVASVVSAFLTPLERAGSSGIRTLSSVGALLFVLLLALTGYSYLSARTTSPGLSLLNNASFVYYISLYTVNAHAFRSNRFTRFVLAYDILAFTYELTSGSKGRFALFVVFPIILARLFYSRRPSRRFLTVTLAIFSVSTFVIYPLLVEYRKEVSSNAEMSPELVSMGNAAGRWSNSYADKVVNLVSGAGTAEHVTALCSIIFFDMRLPSDRLIERLGLFWVPRLIWPDKPSQLSGNEVGRASGRISSEDSSTSVVITGLGELYIYFGIIGCLGMLIPGFAFCCIESAFYAFPEETFPSPVRVGVGLMWLRLFPEVVTGSYESAVTGIGVTAAILLSTFYLVWFLNGHRGTRNSPLGREAMKGPSDASLRGTFHTQRPL